MSLELERPAPFLDLAAMHARDDLPLSARKRGFDAVSLASIQKRTGISFGFRDETGLCVICGGYASLPPSADGTRRLEAWFACRSEAAAHMAAFVKLAQLTLRAQAEDAAVEVHAFVAEGHRPGARIARALGFAKAAASGGYENWVWRGAPR